MKKYRITVNGKTFDVDVEEVGGRPSVASATVVAPPAASAPVVPVAVTSPKPVAVTPQTTAPAAKPAGSAGGSAVMKSPLPGKILKVMATPGSSWKKGDTLLIIEAMKMENEILAPRDCRVEEVAVQANQSVKTGDLLLKLS
ncbi:MAG: biotin/lipoyl-containing protein [Candidatus Cryosericum sp.]